MGKTVRFWHGWPKYSQEGEDFYADCDDPPRVLFHSDGRVAFSDDAAVDPDASPPVQEDCCCCAECKYCTDTKKPSMVKVVFSGVADGILCSSCDETFNGTVFELYCSRSGSGVIGGGICCYELGFVMTGCTYDELLYCIHSNYDPGSGSIETPFVQVTDNGIDPVVFRKNAGLTYDIDCEAERTDLVDDDDSEFGDLCDWTGASFTVTPYDCDDVL